jgi:thiosulfate/3-mercaptopyruvate sulfurtransferase
MHPLITTAALAERLPDPSLVVVDVRHDLAQPEAWGAAQYRAGHVPGAVFAHNDRDLSAPRNGRNGRHPLPSVGEAEAAFSRLGIGNDSTVVAYDQGSGMFASRLWWMLRWLGHDAVAVLDGGFDKWTREGRPIDAREVVRAKAVFQARSVGPVLSSDDVTRSLTQRDRLLVDARAAERYRGDVEPMDPVAGHIPGARNRPYADNLGADGSFKEPSRLRDEFARLLGDVPLDRVAHYCGSGVSACHNLLAMEVAGLPGSRLYAGSWSEWVSDRTRPVARGADGGKR